MKDPDACFPVDDKPIHNYRSPMMEHSQPHGPQRVSALYQYHNAPEVAPTQGLEYDDNVYLHSDKYPVVQQEPYVSKSRSGRRAFQTDNGPPRIIFGMKVRTFLFVALFVVIVVVGASVGGAVGGKNVRDNAVAQVPITNGTAGTAGTATSAASTGITSTYSAPIPTYTPLSDCPQSNATIYESSFSSKNYTKWCEAASPLDTDDTLSEAFVYSFNDCIELCASINTVSSNGTCNVAVYRPRAGRPANCFAGFNSGISASSLQEQDGTGVALLHRQ